MIRLKNIKHSYDTKLVLEDLNLDIESQKITCILGSSGSGKTSILRLIAGLEKPNSGEISIDGQLLSNDNKILVLPKQRGLGFIFQDLALWPHFTVYKNIAFALTEQKEKHVKDKVLEMLKTFNLEEYSNKFPHQLSGGEKQLLAIARALVLKPKILLMDEPLSNLDVKLKRKMLGIIKDLKQNFDLSIVYVSHDHKEAFAIADQIVVLEKGKIEAEGTPEEIKNSNNIFVKYFLEY